MDTMQSTTARAFPHIDHETYLEELIIRIKKPKSINQGQVGFCGPAAVLYALANDEPMTYARLATELYLHGQTTVRTWVLKAGALASIKPTEDQDINICDWVTMSCIRTNMSIVGTLTSLVGVATGAHPLELVACFKGLGYTNVVDDTYSGWFNTPDLKNLRMASDLWARKYKVVLCVNSDMFAEKPTTSTFVNHFCTLKSVVEIKNKKISCRVWQWGIDKKEPDTDRHKIHVNLDQDMFMSNYFGYVAAGDLV
jgi:hypothetical protein